MRATLPTGSANNYFVESGATFVPGLAVSRAWPHGLRLAANAAYRFRRAARLLDLHVDDEIEVKGGLGWRGRTGWGAPIGLDAVLFASTAAARPLRKAGNDPVEALAAGSYGLGGGRYTLFAGGALGLHEGYGTSDWRLFLGVRATFAPPDPDRDGVPAAADRCPTEAEDRDEHDDADGCPDRDDDGDGVDDQQDRCPLGAGRPADEGCPARHPRVELLAREGARCHDVVGGSTRGPCALRGRVVFGPGSAALPPGADALIGEVVDALLREPRAALRIYADADDAEDPAANVALAEARAAALRGALVERGAPGERITRAARASRRSAGPTAEFVLQLP